MCNMDSGVLGGWCESCPGNTDGDCLSANFPPLGTDECRNACVGHESENTYNLF